jgi:hypothetical protein
MSKGADGASELYPKSGPAASERAGDWGSSKVVVASRLRRRGNLHLRKRRLLCSSPVLEVGAGSFSCRAADRDEAFRLSLPL